MVDKGKGFIEINNTEYILSKGQCAFIDCKIEHSYKCDKNDPWEVKWLHFNGISAKYYFNMFSKESCCVFTPRLINVLNAKVCEIITNNAHKNNKTEIINAKLITDILTAILTNEVIPENGEESVNQMKSVKEYIDNHFTESINLDKISSEFYMNKYYITREFKKEYGETIFQHIIRRRIGEEAVKAAVEGMTGKMMAFKRISDRPYFSEIVPVDANEVANKEKLFPKEWINNQGNNVTSQALDYFLPLIQGELNILMKNGMPVHFKIPNWF